MLGKLWRALRIRFAPLFQRQSVVQPTTPELPPLEPINFRDSIRVPLPHPDLVVDFGTTATVIGMIPPTPGFVEMQLLVGRSEHSSDMTVNAQLDEVLDVGVSAYATSLKTPGSRYFSSLKRYLELLSRQSESREREIIEQIVQGYLVKSIESKYISLHPTQCLGASSHVVVSVPNSFNPTAVGFIRHGVVSAINELNKRVADRAGEVAVSIDNRNVLVVRESEAIAYLYLRESLLGNAPTGTEGGVARFQWISLSDSEGSIVREEGRDIRRIVIIDIGGGTTDLSVLRLDTQEDNIQILLNAGVPLGGVDVDKLVLRAAISGTDDHIATVIRSDVNGKWSSETSRHASLSGVKARKEATGFSATDPNFQGMLQEIGRYLPTDLILDSADIIPEKIRKRLDSLVSLSIDGLFGLIPGNLREGIEDVFLTGRASQLQEIRAAVIRNAGEMGARVLTLSHPYHLKLAVAYGCALVKGEDFAGAKLPVDTLGRRLVVAQGAGGDRIAEFEGSFPISGEVPTLWRASLPCPEKNPTRFLWWEYRTAVTEEQVQELGSNELIGLGLVQCVARPEILPSVATGKVNEQVFLLWHPDTDCYYLQDQQEQRWVMSRMPNLIFAQTNCVTGLPLSFPHEA